MCSPGDCMKIKDQQSAHAVVQCWPGPRIREKIASIRGAINQNTPSINGK